MARQTLVFAHANGVPGASYGKFLAPLKVRFDVTVVEHLGGGGNVGRQWQGLADELEALIAPLPKPIVGMGHSMGAVVMFIVATRRPEWFSPLVMLDPPLINGWVRPVFDVMYAFGQMDRVTPAGKSRGRRDHWLDQAAVQAYFQGRGMFRHFDPDCLADYIESAVVHTEDGWRLRIAPAEEVEIFTETPRNLHRYPRLAVPGLVVNGSSTHEGFKSSARRHVRRHRMSHLEAPGSHMFPLEHPQQAAAQVLQWLDAGEAGHADQ